MMEMRPHDLRSGELLDARAPGLGEDVFRNF